MEQKRHWKALKTYKDIRFEIWNHIAKITINRPEVHNAFRPTTTFEIAEALDICRENQDVYTIILTGEGDKAFVVAEISR